MKFTKIQLASIAIGTTGVVLNISGLATGNQELNYIAVFIGRLSAAVYLTAIDKFRFWSLIPLCFSIANTYYNLPQLLFMEYLSQSIIYQIMAVITFSKINSKKM